MFRITFNGFLSEKAFRLILVHISLSHEYRMRGCVLERVLNLRIEDFIQIDLVIEQKEGIGWIKHVSRMKES